MGSVTSICITKLGRGVCDQYLYHKSIVFGGISLILFLSSILASPILSSNSPVGHSPETVGQQATVDFENSSLC